MPPVLRKFDADGTELIALIVKCLYGHVVSGRKWQEQIHAFMVAPRGEGGLGCVRSTSNPCLYSYRGPGPNPGPIARMEWAHFGLATDNLFDCCSTDELRADIIARLQAKFPWVDEGPISDVPSVLGATAKQDLAAGTTTLSLEGYIETIADEYKDLLTSRKVSTPATSEIEAIVNEALRTKEEPRDPKLIKWYQRVCGLLIFASIVCRPDMSYAAAMLSRAMAYPTEALKAAAIRAINYLVQHKSLCWTASKSTYFSARHRSPKLRKGGADATIDAAFSDADFAAGPSMSGWAVLMAGAVVDYGAKRQSGTMLSSAGSEIVAGSVCATYIMNKRLLLAEHGFPLSGATTLYMDNMAALALAQYPESNHKTKHLERRHHYLRECVEAGEIAVRHVPTEFNIADMFTKALEPKKFRLFRAAVINLPLESLA